MELTRRSFATAAAGLALAASPLAALAEEAPKEEAAEEGAEVEAEEEAAGSITAAPGSIEAAQQLMDALNGEYVELFPVMAQYPDAWVEYLEPYVGDSAADMRDMLITMMEGELIGQEAIDTYGDMSQGFAFNCFFPAGIATIKIEGNVVSGYDADGGEVFSHEYTYFAYDPNMGAYAFRTLDEDAGEYRFFVPMPDCMADTYHTEFRLCKSLDYAFDWFIGDYAFYLSAGIAADADEETVKKCIKLFCDENAAEM